MATSSRSVQDVSHSLLPLLFFIVITLLHSSYATDLNESESLPVGDTTEPATCPTIVPTCHCHCAPVITLNCPSSPPTSCPELPTTAPPLTPQSTTSSPPITGTTGSTLPTSNPTTTTSSTFTPTTTTRTTIPLTTTPPTTTPTTATSSTTTPTTVFTTSTPTTTPTTTTFVPTTPPTTSTTSTPTTRTPSTTTSTTNPTTSHTSSTSSPTTLPNNNCQYVLSFDSGWFTSPNYPNNYPDYAYCSWLINATGPIFFAFTSFALERGFDYVSVFDGPTTSSTRILYVTGSSVFSPVTSSSHQVFVTFSTDSSVTASGFNASYSKLNTATTDVSSTSRTTTSAGSSGTGTWTTGASGPILSTTGPILDNCHAILDSNSGFFSSPYYPSNYPNNANCSWIITATSQIELRFNMFRTQASRDFVKVYNGPTTSSSLLLSHSGTTIPPLVVSSGYPYQLRITFTTDDSVTDLGFNASYSLYIPPTNPPPPQIFACGENVTLNSASDVFIISPNFPNGYPNNSRCIWRITSAPNTRIMFHFTDFSTHSWDYVSVHDGPSESYSRLVYQSGNVSSPSCGFLSSWNALFVSFSSGFTSSPSRGFRARLTTNHGCGGIYNTSNQGVIETPGYQINTTFQFSCTWFIRVASGSKVNLTFTDWVGFSNPDNPQYSLNVYEGSGAYDENLLLSARMFSPSPRPFFVVSKSNEMTILVHNRYWYGTVCSPNERDKNKFRVSYSATTTPKYGCYGSMDVNTKALSSPGHPREYTPRSLSCRWRISQPSGSKINFTFPTTIDTYSGDYFYAYDGPTTNYPLLFRVSGTIHPMPVITSTNETIIIFDTSSGVDNTTLYTGWSTTWKLVN